MELREPASRYLLPQDAVGSVQFRQTEAGLIPADWVPKLLMSVVRVASGQVDPRLEPYRSMVLVAPDHVESGTGRLLAQVTAAEQGAISGKYLVSAGDIVYSKIRPYLRKAILARFDGLCSADMYPLQVQQGVSAGFVLASLLGERFSRYAEAVSVRSGMPKINRDELAAYAMAMPPTFTEQQAIAEALSDADALIDSLSLLLAKKRQIKQGAMQELLTGKKRLPGFNGDWSFVLLGEIAHIKTGERNNQDKIPNGEFPFFVRSAEVERIDSYSYDCEAILVPGEGGIGKIFHYVNGRFDVHQRVYAITKFDPSVFGRYLHIYTCQYFGPYALQNTVKATVDSLRLPTFKGFAVHLPPTVPEQTAIANVIGEIDEQIVALESKLSKVRQLKQGMMQELLIGRIRLLQPASNVIPLTAKPAAAKPSAAPDTHNWQINEAVVIGVLAQRFGSEQFPLPRKRRVKLTYLLHRHAEGKAEGYLKKAAGPYDPNTKYKGPEQIALKNGYVRVLGNGTYEGFVAGGEIEQAQRYFEQWYGAATLEWMERFHYRKTDDLELLATVDMAMVDLAANGEPADVTNVKYVIAAHSEWLPKLSRELFSDERIAAAIAECHTLFGG